MGHSNANAHSVSYKAFADAFVQAEALAV